MKKNFIFCACAAAALVFASCQKEESAPAVNETPSTGMEVITATTLSSKTTTLDGINVLWEDGDKIALFVGAGDRTQSAVYTAELDSPNSTATFVKADDVEPGNYNGTYYAMYPESAFLKWASSMSNPSNSRVYVNLPKEQTAVVGGWNKACGILASTSTTSTFQFNHIMSYIKFTVNAATTPFVSLNVSSKNSEKLTGENIGIMYGESVAYDPTYTSGTYYPTAAISNEDDSEFAPGTYYLVVLPGTFAQGFSFVFADAEGNIVIKELAQEVELKAGDVADMGTIGVLDFAAAEEPGEPEEPADPETPATIELGKAFASEGVVFWIDGENSKKGKIISAAATSLKWGDGTAKSYTWAEYINSNDGFANQEYVLNLDDSNAKNYPAVYYCNNMGEGWRLPTIKEMEQLIKIYYGIEGDYDTTTKYLSVDPYKSNAAEFDAELSACLGETETTTLCPSTASWYWTGQSYYKDGDNNSGKICRVKVGEQVLVSGANATNACNVRCVRDVEVQ